MATLILTVGLPATGKTTLARRLEHERGALRLTKDEWVKALCGDRNPEAVQAVVEGRLIEVALRTLELGVDVVLDFGLWSRAERDALRQAAVDRGADVEIRYCVLDPAEQRRRLDRREADAPHTTWRITDDELAEWAARFTTPTPGEIDALVADISASAAEQSRGLQEVNVAVGQMDHVTQQNAAMVEQATAATHGLAGESQVLGQAVARFRTSRPEPALGSVARLSADPARPPAVRRKVAGGGDAFGWQEF